MSLLLYDRLCAAVVGWEQVAVATLVPMSTVTEQCAGGGLVDLKVRELTVERYRGFRELSISELGRVNLITGTNSSGKSSILDVLRILAHRGSPRVIREILTLSEEVDFTESREPSSVENLFLLGTLFNGNPFQRSATTLDADPISISVDGTLRPTKLTIRISNTATRAEHGQKSLHEDHSSDGYPALIVRIDDAQRTYSVDQFPNYILRGQEGDSLRFSRQGVPDGHSRCVSINPYTAPRTSQFGQLWDSIALSEYEKYVVRALNIIEPKIKAVSMVGDGLNSKHRKAIVRTTDSESPVTIRSFGNGMNRLFGIILSLVSARSGLLLIDEFESGLHHSVLCDAWKMILKLAADLDVQVFATSHSWDAINAFGLVAGENDNHEAVLVKLERIRDEIVPTVFARDELRIITHHQIDVR